MKPRVPGSFFEPDGGLYFVKTFIPKIKFRWKMEARLDFDVSLRLNCFHANNNCWTGFNGPVPRLPCPQEFSRIAANPVAQRGRRFKKRGRRQGQGRPRRLQ